MSHRASRRETLAGGLALAGSALLPGKAGAAALIMNDASRLNPTPVSRHWHVTAPRDDLVEALRAELKLARAEGRPVCVGAARHSMGGQALARHGVAVTLDIDRCEALRQPGLFRVAGGARWHQVIAQLDPLGLSPAVMQSNSDFGVAATFSVNAHGWPTPYGPFGSTVRAIRLMLADGEVVSASRTQNADLFALAMGGYGLAGIILDLEIDVVKNEMLAPDFVAMPAGEFAERFIAGAHEPGVRMIYGRLNVERASFFEEALLVSYRPAPAPLAGVPPVVREGPLSTLSRQVYRAQVEREWGKRLRWFLERSAMPRLVSGMASRNTLMNEPVRNLANSSTRRTDILHEYFVPPARFNDFIAGCRAIIPRAAAEFLNVTLRFVKEDRTPLLGFADTDRIAAVMSFSQKMNPNGEVDMIRTTEALIDLVGGLGGSFYLPYRLHARPDQIARIYPRAGAFAEAKRRVDPGLLFRNTMWDTYFAR